MRWAVRVIVVLVALIVVVPLGLVGWLKFSQPPVSGDVHLTGLGGPGELVWDDNAIPHIFAPTMRDAYRILGWAHARDRMWQMETQRRIGQGRLSELLGKLGLDLDRQMRVLGLYRLAEANYNALDAETRADLDAYAAGVNAYLSHPPAPLPLEFHLLGVTPEPWRPADTLVWGRLMSLQLSGNYREEAIRAALIDKLPGEIFNDIFPDAANPGPLTLSALLGVDWQRFAAHLPTELGPSHASNEWVVDGTMTRSGKPLLANDPHLALEAPIVWYMARIATPEGNLSGVTVPGVPFHMLGHNDRIAWGLTTTGGDVQDLFVEDIDPKDANRYMTPLGGREFKTRSELIKVRFGSDVRLTVRETRHGPVISDIDQSLATAAGPNKAIALSFVGLDPADTTAASVRNIGRAKDWDSFREALKLWKTPEQNIVYADVDGHIGFTSVGPLPLRRKPTDDLPARGANGESDWMGLTDFSQLPQGFDPPSHRFVNANNRVVPLDFPTYIGRHYEEPFRAERINAMLDAGKDYTLADFARMQMDVKEGGSPLLLPRLLEAKPQSERGQQAVALLRSWTGMMDVDKTEPLIYTAWIYRLQADLVAKRTAGGAYSPQGTFGLDPFLIVRLLDHYGAQGSDILNASLDKTLAALGETYGQDMNTWRWGEAHPATLKSRFLGNIPVIGKLFDVGLPVAGGPETVNRGATGLSDGVHFPSAHGPGYRGVFDLADLDSSRFIIATGQSGDPLSRHYGDLAERWRDGNGVTLSGTADQVAAKGLGRMRFLP